MRSPEEFLNFVNDRLEHFNQLCFEGSLPPIPVHLTKARSFLGKICFNTRRGFFGRVLGTGDYSLRISTSFNLSDSEWEDVIIHELIHYYIAYNGVRDTSSHGRVFRSMMERINSEYGRHITVRHRCEQGQLPERERKPVVSHICVSRLADGHWGITRCTERMKTRIDRSLPRFYRLESHTWYTSDDPFFCRYPLSRSPKIYKITREELEARQNLLIFEKPPLKQPI